MNAPFAIHADPLGPAASAKFPTASIAVPALIEMPIVPVPVRLDTVTVRVFPRANHDLFVDPGPHRFPILGESVFKPGTARECANYRAIFLEENSTLR